MEKSKRKKAPGTGILRPLQIPLFQSCFSKSFLPVSQAVCFWPIPLSQFEELLLDDPEVDAIAAPAGLLVDTDLRM